MTLDEIIEIIKAIRDSKQDAVMIFRKGRYEKTLTDQLRPYGPGFFVLRHL